MAHIVLIIYGDIDQLSGGYYYDRELVKALTRRGHTVSVSNPDTVSSLSDRAELYLIDELCHPDFHSGRHFRKLSDGVPTAAIVHHLGADEKAGYLSVLKHLYMEKRFFRYIDFAIYNSFSTGLSVQNRCGYRGPSAVAVPGRDSGDPKADTHAPAPDETRLSLVFLGNLIRRKGLHHVLQHLARINDIPYKFTIAGNSGIDTAYTGEIKEIIRKKKLTDRVEIAGYLDEKKKNELLRLSDALVMLSSHEGWGISYLEAMQFGTIPVAGTSGGAAEFIDDGLNGYLIDPQDGQSLHRVLKELWENPALKKSVSENAARTWANHPTWEKTFNPLIDKLEKTFQLL